MHVMQKMRVEMVQLIPDKFDGFKRLLIVDQLIHRVVTFRGRILKLRGLVNEVSNVSANFTHGNRSHQMHVGSVFELRLSGQIFKRWHSFLINFYARSRLCTHPSSYLFFRQRS